ncbi:uncharacterized protein ATNIH1004_007998 [Aspergillus tanneri]|uniref:Uncharacterized protein n=1 Tax=Aspergillus tanneri TaxID=1220188 RepID=A0A5M9MHU6_9EURO|nr:uncharacterized protein ATNIH1004_007998 [Aspergillus tanneri]KAA8646565.1 hypothetical protein ATNIH1004_007998 [Aspergillus tanneri]
MADFANDSSFRDAEVCSAQPTPSFECHPPPRKSLTPTVSSCPKDVASLDALATSSNNDRHFAIKGGRHSIIPGAANIHDGILMAMSRFNTSVIHEVGCSLGSACAALDPYNLSTIIDYHTLTTNKTANMKPIVYNARVNKLPAIVKAGPISRTPGIHSGSGDTRTRCVSSTTGFVMGSARMNGHSSDDISKNSASSPSTLTPDYTKISGATIARFCNSTAMYPVSTPSTATYPSQVSKGVRKGRNVLGLETVGDWALVGEIPWTSLVGDPDAGHTMLYFGITFENRDDIDRILPAHTDLFSQCGSSRLIGGCCALMQPRCHCEVRGGKCRETLHEVQGSYDPTHVFQRLVPGGQKLSKE